MAGPTAPDEGRAHLHERERELERLAGALERTASGTGQLLLIEGPAGIGKTALLAHAREMAAARGMSVLTARATPIDQDLAFGVVRQLLEPPLRRAGDEHREALLSGTASLAAPVLGFAAGLAEPGPAALHGLYWLLCNLADEAPLLVAVDDAHWADPSTARLLAFLAPRLEDVPCLVLATARPDEPGRALLAGETASDPAARALVPAPLSAPACAAVARKRFGRAPDPGFVDACHSVTGGNPFYLHALLDELARDGVEPDGAAADVVGSVNPGAVSQTIVARLGTLGPVAASLAQALAVLGEPTDPLAVAALAEVDAASALGAVEQLERSGLVVGDDRIDFAHPLVRTAVDGDLGRTRRLALHRRIAEHLARVGADPERAASHIIPIPPTGDPEDLSVLRAAAFAALGRGAPESVAAYLGRALAEPLSDAKRGSVLLQLGVAETTTDLRTAVEHLAESFSLTEDPVRRALIAAALSRAVFFTDRSRDCIGVAREALASLELPVRELRQGLEAILLAAASMEPDLREEAAALAARLRTTGIDGDDLPATALASALTHLEARRELTAEQAVREMRHALRGGVLLSEDNGRAAFCAAVMVLALADDDHALPTAQEGIALAVRRGDLLALTGDKIFAALAHLVRGELAEAVASAEEGLAHGEACGGEIGVPWGTAFLATALLDRGDLDGAEAALARAGVGEHAPDNAHWLLHLDTRARVLAERGDLRAAVETALECGRRYAAVGGRNPALVPWRSRVARWLAILGEDVTPDGARRSEELAAEEVELARHWGAPRALGAALRAQGTVAGGDEGIEALREAVAVLEGSPARLEHAAALVDLGSALRRRGSRTEAREPLGAGLSLARSCGAIPLAERAYEELRASGARPRRILLTGPEALTPSELRVARLAAGGASNREIAQELFVTRKTVEFHLSHAYQKLGISSRNELADALEG